MDFVLAPPSTTTVNDRPGLGSTTRLSVVRPSPSLSRCQLPRCRWLGPGYSGLCTRWKTNTGVRPRRGATHPLSNRDTGTPTARSQQGRNASGLRATVSVSTRGRSWWVFVQPYRLPPPAPRCTVHADRVVGRRPDPRRFSPTTPCYATSASTLITRWTDMTAEVHRGLVAPQPTTGGVMSAVVRAAAGIVDPAASRQLLALRGYARERVGV